MHLRSSHPWRGVRRCGIWQPAIVLSAGAREAQRRNLSLAGIQHAVSDSALGRGAASGIAHLGPHGKAGAAGFAAALRTSYPPVGGVEEGGGLSTIEAASPRPR